MSQPVDGDGHAGGNGYRHRKALQDLIETASLMLSADWDLPLVAQKPKEEIEKQYTKAKPF